MIGPPVTSGGPAFDVHMRTVELLCHFVARLRAHPAGFRAALHHLIPFKAVSVFRATLAHFGTYTACVAVEVRAAQHEIGTGLSYLGAVH